MTERAQRRLDNRGQALVEMALLLPVVMLILIGVVEFGRAWQAKQTLTDVAREAARLSVIGDNTMTRARVDSAVRTRIKGAGFDSSASKLTLSWPNGCHMAGCSPVTSTGAVTAVTLTLEHRFVAIQRLITLATSGGVLTLRTTARMRNE